MTKRKKPVDHTDKPQRKKPTPQAGLGTDLRTRIGEQLRVMHDDIVKEGIPDRFKELLRQLDRGNGENGE